MGKTSREPIGPPGPTPQLHASRSRALVTLVYLTTGAFFLHELLATKPVLWASRTRTTPIANHLGLSVKQVNAELCPQVPALAPSKHSALVDELDDVYADGEYRLWAYENLGAAVRVPTITYDDIGPPGEDDRWETRLQLHDVLKKRFPLIHQKLEKTVVNTYNLVYHWQGSDNSLKPLLLMGHQDVVPVNPDTLDDWINPPFSGYYDGEWIWGRGSCDDKSGTIGTLTAIESLLQKGFEPTRTVVLAFGIDEERGGIDGAKVLKDYLVPRYGRNGIALIVDEGGGYQDKGEVVFSVPNVAEKGKFNARIDVYTTGGHSSVPPPHTGIGYLSRLITELEANPLPARLTRHGTYFKTIQCQAAFDPATPKHIRALVAKASYDDEALAELQAELTKSDEKTFRAFTGTTQAIDLIGGGVKVNALPEHVWAVADHRIAQWSSVAELQGRYCDVLGPVATELNLSLDAFGSPFFTDAYGLSSGHIRLSDAYGTALDPVPVTPTFGSTPWEILSGTILSSIKTSGREEASKPIIVAPGIGLGNTDTRHFLNLTEHIVRYAHGFAADRYNGAHTVNEAIRGTGFIEMIRFYTRLILNVDEATTI
ncbi:carboxypeptidase S [Peniophora sp. CONT]|nr:carboxypeptidase S [Peniophora sp. CONT]